jgi:antitoxin component YwqK of YwqJK toxin-antitoxin module
VAIKIKGSYIRGKKYGRWQTVKGNRSTIAHYRNGILHGLWKRRYTDGSHQTYRYFNGRRNGPYAISDKVLGTERGRYLMGKRHGPFTARKPSGEKIEGAYSFGKKSGRWRRWWANKKLRLVETYYRGLRHGLQTKYSKAGRPILRCRYQRGILVGKCQRARRGARRR